MTSAHHDHGHHEGRHRRHQQEEAPHSHGPEHGHEALLSVEDAYSRVLAAFRPLEPEEKPLLEALGQVLAEDIRAPLNIPGWANSSMDGYAVQQADIMGASPERPRQLRVMGVVPAGQAPTIAVHPGTAIRIMTGAPIPEGADTVVPFEATDEVARKQEGRPLNQVAIYADLPTGCNVRPAGEDVERDELVLEAGTPLRPAALGVIASLGIGRVKVIRRPAVAVLSTGDELAAIGEALQPGKIYDSNTFTVAASVAACGGVPLTLGVARDNLPDLSRKLAEAAGADLVLTSAGVSRGDYDIVKEALSQRGEMNFWSVRMRPAKPLAFGMLRGEGGRFTPLLGLPGNPVSALVAFEMFARPAILTMQGRRQLQRPVVEGILTGPIHNTDGRRVYARVEVTRRDGVYYASPTGPQGSNILTSMARANGLAICPEDLPRKNAGERVSIIMLDWNEEVNL